MGYTHYWDVCLKNKTGHDQDTWSTFVQACKKLYKKMPQTRNICGTEVPLKLGGCYRYKYPKFTSKQIHFNGSSGKRILDNLSKEWGDAPHNYGEVIAAFSHETFLLIRTGESGFCKTDRKPYDLMVTTCLLLYKYYFPDEVEISSDGTREEWNDAFLFIGSVLEDGEAVAVELDLMLAEAF